MSAYYISCARILPFQRIGGPIQCSLHGGYGWFNRQMLWRIHVEKFVRTFGPAQYEMGMDVLHKGWELYWIHEPDQKIHSFYS
jgi:hypothetical protein